MKWMPISAAKRLLFLSVGLVTGLWIFQGLAQEPVSSQISVTAERMTVRNLEHRVFFEGEVQVQKGDFQMMADQMVVTFAPVAHHAAPSRSLSAVPSQTQGSRPDGRAVSTIEASGHVKIIYGDRRATSEAAIYDRVEDKAVLTGNPESWEKDYKVSGTKITIFLKENRSLVEGSSVLIQP